VISRLCADTLLVFSHIALDWFVICYFRRLDPLCRADYGNAMCLIDQGLHQYCLRHRTAWWLSFLFVDSIAAVLLCLAVLYAVVGPTAGSIFGQTWISAFGTLAIVIQATLKATLYWWSLHRGHRLATHRKVNGNHVPTLVLNHQPQDVQQNGRPLRLDGVGNGAPRKSEAQREGSDDLEHLTIRQPEPDSKPPKEGTDNAEGVASFLGLYL